MGKILSLIILIAVIYGVYTYREPIRVAINANTNNVLENIYIPTNTDIENFVNKALNKAAVVTSRCNKPITYSLANFDTEFNIDRPYFLRAIGQAEKLWEEESGKNLFQFEESGGNMAINLVYDYRQQTTDELKKLGITVNQTRASYEELKAKYNAVKASYLSLKTKYDAAILAYNARVKTWSASVTYWNNNGGAPKKEYDELTAEKAALDLELAKLKNQELAINNLVNQVNGLANMLNKQAQILNLSVQKYNTVGGSLGDTYEEGLYYSDGVKRGIDIYEFQTYNQLVRILAHEMGHAIGIQHLENSESIMYKMNTGKNLILTTEDKTALAGICGLQTSAQ